MRLHFYKLHLGGNSFILIDNITDIPIKEFEKISKVLCSRKFGIGASGCLFLDKDNNLYIYNHKGYSESQATDALLCAARFAFDSGRINKIGKNKKSIIFNTNIGKKELNIISSREFEISLGTPFSLFNDNVLTQEKANCMDSIIIDGRKISVFGIHIIQDNIVLLNSHVNDFSFFEVYLKMHKSLNNKKTYLTFARNITKETLSLRTLHHGLSTICSSSAAALITSYYAGTCNKDAICTFEYGNPNLFVQQNNLKLDLDNSRKLTVLWNTEKNELKAIGSGGYLFEGFFDYEDKNA